MSVNEGSRTSRLYQEALTRSGADRLTFLTHACAGDGPLRQRLERLLAETDAPTVASASASDPGAAAALLPGDFAGTARFEVRRRLGQGGFGIVYEVLDRKRGALVALKVLHATHPAALARFKREFRTFADLTHPNLVVLDELFSDTDRWFFTMELIRGRPIVDFVRSPIELATQDKHPETSAITTQAVAFPPPGTGVVDEGRTRDAFGQLVEALLAIHRHGVVHRDIKPSNVLVTADGRTVVLDFGIAIQMAPVIMSTTVAGTPAYMAPEQAFEDGIAPACDWYSVGVMLFEALAGRLPFTGTWVDMLLSKRNAAVAQEALAGTAPSDLLTLSLELLDPNPSKRPDGPAVLQRLRGADPIRVPAPRGDGTSAPVALIGRNRHLRALASGFEAARAGQLVVMFMPGPSGAGKSALLHQFLAEVRGHPDVPFVAAGRCHEREFVPYKAVDGLVDGLAVHLGRLSDIEAARLLPRATPLLARLFPVLSRVPEIARAQARVATPSHPLELRRQASTALRELLARVADHAPCVLAIDDLQWGDLDSAYLLQEIVRLPDPPPVLLLLAYRAEDQHAPLVRTLRESLAADAARRDVRTLPVDELTFAEAYDLARRELEGRTDIPSERSAEIGRESRGNSFFVHELVRHALTVGGPARLDTVIRDRVNALPHSAQQMLTAIALSAQPITAAVASAAAGLERDGHDALRALRAGRLVRMHDSAGEQEHEPYHDRIRETVARDLQPSDAVMWQARLARAWEASGCARPETLVTHFRAAGDCVASTRYARLAAEDAERALAFRRAADYYRLLIEIDDPSEQFSWRMRLGDALARAGRGRESATAYREALADATPDTAIELERRAAEQLIRAGYLDEASRVLESLLPRIGLRPPRTEGGAFAGLIIQRLILRLWGIRFTERSEVDVAVDDLRRIDVLWSIGAPLSLVELARGNHLHLRGAYLALRAGEPTRVVRALSTLACASAIAGSRCDRQTSYILEEAKRLAARLRHPTSIAHAALADAICQKVVGRWVMARERLEHAIEALRPLPGVRWEVETARTLLHDTLFWMGDWKRVFDEIPERRKEAEDCGDLYTATHVAVRLTAIAHLAADEPDAARVAATTGMARWPSRRIDLQHRWEVCSLIEADLYSGYAADAWDRLQAAWPLFRWTLRAFQNSRIEMRFYRARIALARAADGQSGYLDAAVREASHLEREDAAWATALARLVRASASATRGRAPDALSQLIAAEPALLDAGMRHYAEAAKYRRGQLVGGDEGSALQADAYRFFKGQGVVDPERIMNLLAPGRWSHL